jgi:hypothetical protein
MEGKVSRKGLISYLSFVSFLIMLVTGIVLYFEPQGRVAYWTHWSFLGLTKTGWDHIHITSSVLFTFAAVYHLVLNWRVFISYLREKAGQALRLKAELLISVAAGLVLIFGTIYSVPPFGSIVELSGYLKERWVKSPAQEPPYGHAELSKLRVLAKRTGIEPAAAIVALKERRIEVSGSDEVFEDIARQNDMSPMELFGLISYLVPKEVAPVKWTPQSVEERFEGTGIGHKELRWIMQDLGVDRQIWFTRLASAGIDAMSDETIKQTAKRNRMKPIEVLKAALIEGYMPERE